MFEDEKNLYSLPSGFHGHKDIEKDLMNTEVIYRKQQEEFSTNTSKISSKTGKALVERDMLSRVLVAREFPEEDISLKRVVTFSPVTRCTVIIFIG